MQLKKDVKEEPFDNTWHPTQNKKASEWWYYTLLCTDKTIISGCLTLTGANKTNLRGGMWIAIYHPQYQPVQIVKVNSKRFDADTDSCNILVDNNCFYNFNNHFYLKIDQDNVRLKIKASSEFNFKNNTFNLKLNEGRIDWIVPVLRGNFSGELQINNTRKKITGIFFHDHVKVDIKPSFNLIRNFKGWAWGLMYDKNETLLYLQANYKPKPLNIIYHEKKGKVIKPEGIVHINRNLVQVLYEQNSFVSKLDRVNPIYYYESNYKWLSRTVDTILGAKKFHAYNTKNHYLECLKL